VSVAIDRELLAERAAAVDRHLLMRRVHAAATGGPADLRAFLAALRDHAG
jgi:hypothetical protein